MNYCEFRIRNFFRINIFAAFLFSILLSGLCYANEKESKSANIVENNSTEIKKEDFKESDKNDKNLKEGVYFLTGASLIVGSKNFGPERWRVWRDSYFPKVGSRGLAKGLGVEASAGFMPLIDSFALELSLGAEKILARNEDKYANGKITAEYDLTRLKLATQLLSPLFWGLRFGLGAGFSYIDRVIFLKINDSSRSDRNKSRLDFFVTGTFRAYIFEPWLINLGLLYSESDGSFVVGGVSYVL